MKADNINWIQEFLSLYEQIFHDSKEKADKK